MIAPAPLLEMHGVRVAFGGLVANDDVSLTVRAGEIHALLGENGAGKSTLMRVLAGLIAPDAGEIRIEGQTVHFKGPRDAIEFGIGMVHQHFMLVPTLSVAENVILGSTSKLSYFRDRRAAEARVAELARAHGLDVDPRARVSDLSIASRQRVEILKVLCRGARLLILDEPTAVLSPAEADGLFGVLRSLAAENAAIIFISHKLREVMSLTSRVTVLRRGRVAATLDTAGTEARSLARLMVGDDVHLPALQRAATTQHSPEGGQPLLSVEGLVCRTAGGAPLVDRATLQVWGGEIVGVAGVDGNGQRELAEAIVGLREIDAGKIAIDGEEVNKTSVARRIALGLAHIPEDRQRTALVEAMSVEDNIILETVGETPLSKRGWLNRIAIATRAREITSRFDIRVHGIRQTVGSLSGGNQQKVVLGRALARDPRLIIAVQPTRGLDIGATAFVHRQLIARRAEGAGVLMVSTELDEILAICDRILVMFNGGVIGALDRREATLERLGWLMSGRAA